MKVRIERKSSGKGNFRIEYVEVDINGLQKTCQDDPVEVLSLVAEAYGMIIENITMSFKNQEQ